MLYIMHFMLYIMLYIILDFVEKCQSKTIHFLNIWKAKTAILKKPLQYYCFIAMLCISLAMLHISITMLF